jgi:hypothetical protein
MAKTLYKGQYRSLLKGTEPSTLGNIRRPLEMPSVFVYVHVTDKAYMYKTAYNWHVDMVTVKPIYTRLRADVTHQNDQIHKLTTHRS